MKNYADAIIFHRAICAEASQISHNRRRKFEIFAAFLSKKRFGMEDCMKYELNVGEVTNPSGKVKGFASVVFGDCFKVSNITILENRQGEMYISMPYYAKSRDDEIKDICHPITREFRQKLESRARHCLKWRKIRSWKGE